MGAVVVVVVVVLLLVVVVLVVVVVADVMVEVHCRKEDSCFLLIDLKYWTLVTIL